MTKFKTLVKKKYAKHIWGFERDVDDQEVAVEVPVSHSFYPNSTDSLSDQGNSSTLHVLYDAHLWVIFSCCIHYKQATTKQSETALKHENNAELICSVYTQNWNV